MLGHRHRATPPQPEGPSGVPLGGGKVGRSGDAALDCREGLLALGRGWPPSVHFPGAVPPNSTSASAPENRLTAGPMGTEGRAGLGSWSPHGSGRRGRALTRSRASVDGNRGGRIAAKSQRPPRGEARLRTRQASNTELRRLDCAQDSAQPRACVRQWCQSPGPGEEFCADKTGQTHPVGHVRGGPLECGDGGCSHRLGESAVCPNQKRRLEVPTSAKQTASLPQLS